MDYQQLQFAYTRPTELDAAAPAHHPVVVVGAGPVGLTLAIDLAQRGQPVLLLDNDHKLSTGSRAICFAQRTLQIWDRLGVGQRMVDKGVSWQVGRVFFGDTEVYQFDLQPEPGHERPAFINLQQYYAEGFLVERAMQLPLLQMRWDHRVSALQQDGNRATLTVDTPDGAYTLTADHVVACDGSRSTLRTLLGQASKGRVFQDRFLIADLKLAQPLFANDATERWFWFDPPFHRGQSVLLHRQPDNVWRMDFQLGWDADPDAEKQPERITPRVQQVLRQGFGRDVPFTLEWASVYTFACLRMDRFRHGRVVFAGDSAHGVSPFGARGANSGVQDAENLAWKLVAVLRGQAPDALLDSYTDEREFAADENLLNSTRSTDFITPKSDISRLFRNAALHLARDHAFARRIVNSGRLSVPATLDGSALNSADDTGFGPRLRPGTPALDAPLQRQGRPTWLLRELGAGFTLLVFGPAPAWAGALAAGLPADVDLQLLVLDDTVQADTPSADTPLADTLGLAAQRYDAQPGTAYLLRPDTHVAARWRQPTAGAVRAAVQRALGHAEATA